MKKFLLVAPLFSFIIQSADAVKTASLEADAITLEAGMKVSAVCYLRVLSKHESGGYYLDQGSGSLVAPDIIMTAAHMFLSDRKNKKIIPGTPTEVFGFVTFSADARQVIHNYECNPTPENLAPFYETDSVIIHHNYTDSFSDPNDIAFIKLKRPVKGIDPIPLYSKGLIPEPKLKLHNQGLAITDESMSVEELLIDAYGYGYGLDTFQEDGKKRGIYLPTFIGLDNSEFKHDSSSTSTSHEENGSNIGSESDGSEDSAIERATKANEGDVVSLTSSFSGPRVVNKLIPMSKIQNQFHDNLYEIVRKKNETSGLIDSGDSGGPLLVSGKIVGLNNQADECSFRMRHVKVFSDVSQLSRSVYSFATPLFNYKTGELRPELPEMIDMLQAYPLSHESDLENLILFEQRKKSLQTVACALAISDLEKLLLPDLPHEEFESIISKYSTSNPENTIPTDFNEALEHFKMSRMEAFYNIVQEKIEKINVYVRKLNL